MRIVVKNIQNLQEQQVQKILSEWIPLDIDPSSYYVVEGNIGTYYTSVPNSVLPKMATEFNAKAQKKLGSKSSIQISLVQDISLQPCTKHQPNKIKDDPMFKEYLKNPTDWSLKSSQSKKKQGKKNKHSAAGKASAQGASVATKKDPQPTSVGTKPVKANKGKQKESIAENGEPKPQNPSKTKKPKKKSKPAQAKPENLTDPPAKPAKKKASGAPSAQQTS